MSNRETLASVKANLLHEALQRAIKIAPTKGAGFDKAAGLLFDIEPGEITIRATDLERTFYQRLPSADTQRPFSFRIHTHIAKFVASLPMGGDQDVRFHIDHGTGRIEVQYMKSPTKIKVPQIVGEYPTIEWHEYDEMDNAFELSSKLSSVAWATEDSASGTLAGVMMNGEWIEALCSKQMARIKCDVTTDAPVIAILKTLAPLIAQGSRVRIKAQDSRIVVALDETAQVTSSTVLGQWPNLTERLEKIELPNSFKVNRQRLLEALSRVTAFTNGDRFPRINFLVMDDRIVITLTEAKDGDITDVIALSGKTGQGECEFVFNPVWLQRAIDTFPGAEIQCHYADNKMPLKLSEPMTSYTALIMGLQPGEKQESPKDD